MVRINYYPPRGDNKEGWDNIDIFGWMGYPMQIKVDFLCPGLILAAPIVLDWRCSGPGPAGRAVRQPGMAQLLLEITQTDGTTPAEHDIFIQQTKLKNTLRRWMGEEPVTHSEVGRGAATVRRSGS